MDKDASLKTILEFYLNSRDFNGIHIMDLGDNYEELRLILLELLENESIIINFGDRHPNPHILAFKPESKEEQINKLLNLKFEKPTVENYGPVKVGFSSVSACVYPSKKLLEKAINPGMYRETPFTRRLALGDPQLSYESFDLSILELYRNDPRYYYHCDDVSGYISVKSEYYETEQMMEKDQVLLETFGFSYDNEMNRAVSAFLCYLSKLSPEHQQIWNAKKLNGGYKLHPDYYRNSMGEWSERESIFTAFVEELYHINEMCALMMRPKLFRETHKDVRPNGFGFLIRPTLKEYGEFVLLLDQMLSENIDRSFFMRDINFEREHIRKDGKTIIVPKGTLQILDEWLCRFRFPDSGPREEMIKTFKLIRRLRRYPAHTINENIFDQKYFKDQRLLIIDAYQALRTLRLIFANHPNVKGYKVPDWLHVGKIWTY